MRGRVRVTALALSASLPLVTPGAGASQGDDPFGRFPGPAVRQSGAPSGLYRGVPSLATRRRQLEERRARAARRGFEPPETAELYHSSELLLTGTFSVGGARGVVAIARPTGEVLWLSEGARLYNGTVARLASQADGTLRLEIAPLRRMPPGRAR